MYLSWTDIENGVGDQMTQTQLDRLGIHLIPLYHQLIKFQRDIWAATKTTYTDRRGSIHPYPQFREVREILEAINREIKLVKLDEVWMRKFGTDKSIPGAQAALALEEGVPGSYERMAGAAK
jgi:hypothetical protein